MTRRAAQQLAIDFARHADHGLPGDAQRRFWRFVDARGDGCWLWTGNVQSAGYGTLRDDSGRMVLAHRFSLELHAGPAPADRPIAMHRCDTPRCVRPQHLRWATTLENQRDKAAKGRARNQHTTGRSCS